MHATPILQPKTPMVRSTTRSLAKAAVPRGRYLAGEEQSEGEEGRDEYAMLRAIALTPGPPRQRRPPRSMLPTTGRYSADSTVGKNRTAAREEDAWENGHGQQADEFALQRNIAVTPVLPRQHRAPGPIRRLVDDRSIRGSGEYSTLVKAKLADREERGNRRRRPEDRGDEEVGRDAPAADVSESGCTVGEDAEGRIQEKATDVEEEEVEAEDAFALFRGLSVTPLEPRARAHVARKGGREQGGDGGLLKGEEGKERGRRSLLEELGQVRLGFVSVWALRGRKECKVCVGRQSVCRYVCSCVYVCTCVDIRTSIYICKRVFVLTDVLPLSDHAQSRVL